MTIYTYDTVDEAVALANDTDYGLNASIWGTDLKAAEAVGRRIQAGNININDALACSYASKATPSGGLKNSGVGARHGDAGLLKYTDVQQRRGAQEAGAHQRPPEAVPREHEADPRRSEVDAQASDPLTTA